ncbi:hypothetical protein PVL30_000124 [Lodderomyces elongisporus]|uniref:uncharacterized protein n=1 Tax=Lodderomyces elongisporus TaxID=36914 RepID=UPI0029203243|nr:uncharacterized protein PVL30_000124 [Lodderomyces elongisporus]WLF76422.1 hypothetical protein PVL30_000124 [Lodderomyces elongisporus]
MRDNSNSFQRPMLTSLESVSSTPTRRSLERFNSRTGASQLPHLPRLSSMATFDELEREVALNGDGYCDGGDSSAGDAGSSSAVESYVEYNFGSNHTIASKDSLRQDGNGSTTALSTSNQVGNNGSHDSESKKDGNTNTNTNTNDNDNDNSENTITLSDTKVTDLKNQDDDDFFNTKSDSAWKEMKTISDLDFYDDRGQLKHDAKSGKEFMQGDNYHFGYTKIDTEEQVNKYAALDKKTDFLFASKSENVKKRQTDPAVLFDADDSDSDYDNDEELDSAETLADTKKMLTDSQKFAYVGLAKLITVNMATQLAKVQFGTDGKVAKQLSLGQKNFSNWTLYVLSKLYEHLSVAGEEKTMIENLSKHGVEITDLTSSLREVELKHVKKKTPFANSRDFDLRWVIICDMLLLLLSDGYYDARSRTLLINFAQAIEIPNLEVLQFERRMMECLDMETKEKSIENKDESLNDQSFVQQQIRKNKNKRLVMIGLATLGGGLAIGLSAGLLAPVIGAGIAAGLTTVGITGTSGFLAGVGGSALITTGGIAIGAKVGNKAGARRTGDVQTFEFKPLHNNKRTNLIVTVSGWMNGEMDDVRLPFSTVDPVMGDMFSLLWEPEMLQSMGQTIGILASEALSTSIQQILGATILSALMSAIQLPMALSKLSYLLDNPWNVSLDRAWKAGKILAETILSGNLGVRPITLVGFSLGARLIYSCLIEVAKRGGYGLIENVILLGSPISINIDQLALARSVVSGRFINGYSKKDWILGYLFRATGGGISTVAGLSALKNVEGVENFDCTEYVEGHMSYRKAIPKILKNLDWEVLSEEFAEIEEPDPEEGERQRQLINEFDEAREKIEKEEKEGGGESTQKGWKSWFKPKKKDWWDIYGGGNTSANGQSKVNVDDKGDTIEEYDENASPEFDLGALAKEVNEIEHQAGEKQTKSSS